jgi:hypothetical protein
MKDRILMINDFLDDDESLCLLGTMDLIVYPYQETSESASGAIRFGLASHRPVAITPIDIFQDVRALCHVLPGVTPAEIGAGIDHLLKNPQILDSLKEKRLEWVRTHSWRTLAKRLDAMIQAMMRNDEDRQEKESQAA